MRRRIQVLLGLNLALVLTLGVASLSGQEPGAGKGAPKAKGGKGKTVAPRPGLFLKEIWANPANNEHPITQADVAGQDLELKIYGCKGEGVQMTGTPGLDANPPHTWTGVCEEPSAFGLRHKTKMADLTGLARIKANIKTSGYHQVRPMVKLADGTYLVADQAVGTFTDWLNYEWAVGDLKWLRLDPARVVTTGTWVANPDLSKVDEIGFADLMPGSGHGPGGWSDVAEIEIYANSSAR